MKGGIIKEFWGKVGHDMVGISKIVWIKLYNNSSVNIHAFIR